jgi:hypothetical protein
MTFHVTMFIATGKRFKPSGRKNSFKNIGCYSLKYRSADKENLTRMAGDFIYRRIRGQKSFVETNH